MDELETGAQTDLREYLRILNRRKVVIALTAVVAVGLALVYSFVKSPTYSAKATVLIPQQQAASALNIQNSQLQNPQALQRSIADEQQFALGDSVKQAAAKTLGYQAKVRVGSSTTADVLTFSASSGDKVAAAAIANAYAHAYITARRANQVDQYTQQVTALETSITRLQAKADALPATDPQRAALQQSITTLTQTVEQTQAASQLVDQVGPTVVNAAVVPTSAASPKPTRNGALGLVLGLIIGIGLAFLFERLDDGINSREAAERACDGLPVIALIPMVDSWKARDSHHVAIIEDPTSSVAEAYRTLRTSVQFLSIDRPNRVLGITSSIPGEGKTTAVANLAVSFARAGQRVTVVSCDLRRPRVHEFFGLENRVGLTSILLGETKLGDAVQVVPTEPQLRILTSGPVPPNPAEILSLDRVVEVIEVLSGTSDVILLDCPPVLPVTDALLLSRLVDGMLVLTSTKSTSVRDLHRTFELLAQVQAPVMGTILNRVPADGGYAYGYGYGYYGRYQEGSVAKGTSGATRQLDSPSGERRASSSADPNPGTSAGGNAQERSSTRSGTGTITGTYGSRENGSSS